MSPDDTITDDASSILGATADIFDQTAGAVTDPSRRQMLQDFAKLYREMTALADESDDEVDDEVDATVGTSSPVARLRPARAHPTRPRSCLRNLGRMPS